jgi:hypothetical protein
LIPSQDELTDLIDFGFELQLERNEAVKLLPRLFPFD